MAERAAVISPIIHTEIEHRFVSTTIASLFLCLFISGCEKVVSNPDWPEYKESLILNAHISITPDSTVVVCDLGRTVPLTQHYNWDATRVNDASIIVLRGADTIRLLPATGIEESIYITHKIYYNYRAVVPTVQSQSYTIQAHHGSLQVSGTILPARDLITEFDTLYVVRDSLYGEYSFLQFWFHAMYGFDYQVKFMIAADPRDGQFPWYSWNHHIPPGGTILKGGSGSLKKGLWITSITAASPEYYPPEASSTESGPFETNGKNPPHNVFGNGIGFFSYEITGPTHQFEVY